MQRVSGWAEQGGHSVVVGGLTSTAPFQGSYPLATVTVYLTGTLTLATIFSDNSSTPQSNPFTADANGFWFFYAANGRYDVRFSGGGIPSPFTIGDVLLADPAGGGTTVSSITGGAGILASPSTGAVTVTNTWGAAPSGSQLQYLRIQPNTGNNTTLQFASLPLFYPADYDFPAQTPGGSLVIGSNTITLSPVPLGVNGTDTAHYLYIPNGTGTPEPVLITGGTAVSGAASGTVIVTCANTHSGSWTIKSATGGISEAIWAMPSTGGRIAVAGGTTTLHAPIKRRSLVPLWIQGQGNGVTTLAVAADFPTSGVNGVIDWTGSGLGIPEGGGADFTISFIQPDSTNVATYTHWKPAIYITGSYFSTWENLSFVAAWDGVVMTGNNNGAFFSRIVGSYFHRLFDLQGTSGTGFDTVDVERSQGTTTGLTSNQATAFLAVGTGNIGFYVGTVNDLNIRGSEINSVLAADFHTGGDGSAAGVHLSDIWWEGQTTVSDGTIDIVNMHTSGGVVGSAVYLAQTGGFVKISNSRLFYRGTNSAISATASASTVAVPIPGLQISNSYFNLGSVDASAIVAAAGAPYTGVFNVNVANSQFDRTAGGTYATSTVTATSGTGDVRLTATGNTFYPNAGGTGTAINLGSDNYHVITGNQGGGWSYSVGASPTKTQWANNLNFVANTSTFQDPVNLQRGTGIAVAGAVTLSKQSGTITSEALVTAAGATYTLTLTNTLIATTSQVYCNAFLGSSAQGVPQIVSATPGAGSCVIVVKNIHATLAFNGTIKIQFLVF